MTIARGRDLIAPGHSDAVRSVMAWLVPDIGPKTEPYPPVLQLADRAIVMWLASVQRRLVSTQTINLDSIEQNAKVVRPDIMRGLLTGDPIVARLLPDILDRVRAAYPPDTPVTIIPHPAEGDDNPAITIEVKVPHPTASTFDPLDDVLSGYNQQLDGSEIILLPGVYGL